MTTAQGLNHLHLQHLQGERGERPQLIILAELKSYSCLLFFCLFVVFFLMVTTRTDLNIAEIS